MRSRQLWRNVKVFRAWKTPVEELRLAHLSRNGEDPNGFAKLPKELLPLIEDQLWRSIAKDLSSTGGGPQQSEVLDVCSLGEPMDTSEDDDSAEDALSDSDALAQGDFDCYAEENSIDTFLKQTFGVSINSFWDDHEDPFSALTLDREHGIHCSIEIGGFGEDDGESKSVPENGFQITTEDRKSIEKAMKVLRLDQYNVEGLRTEAHPYAALMRGRVMGKMFEGGKSVPPEWITIMHGSYG